MNERTKLALWMLATALLLGILGDALLRTLPWGLNITLWMAALLAVLLVLGRWRQAVWARGGHWILLPLILFSLDFLWRDAPALKLLNVLALLVALSLLILRAQGGPVRLASILQYALGSVIAGLNAAFGLVPVLFGEIRWNTLVGDRGSQRALAVARGVLISLPLLLVFGALFVGADAVFEGIVKNALHVDFVQLFKHFLMIAFWAWCAGGFLRGLLLGKEWEWAADKHLPTPSLGIIEIGTVLSLLDILFLAFVVVQVRYFFGGAALVQATTGLTYAEYARRGFFELVAVAALVLPLLLFTHWLLAPGDARGERAFRLLAGAQILLLFVIMTSAFQRMRLYQAEYGLTEQRLYVTAFMGWLAVVFVWFAATVLSGHGERFAFGAMVAGFLLIAALHVLNPDALIVRTNAARAKAGRPFDARYATFLSADAVPELVASLPELNPQDRCTAAARLLKRWPEEKQPDWRAWSRSRSQALRVVRENAAALRAMSCSEPHK
jgi:hypothetical protein